MTFKSCDRETFVLSTWFLPSQRHHHQDVHCSEPQGWVAVSCYSWGTEEHSERESSTFLVDPFDLKMSNQYKVPQKNKNCFKSLIY